MRIDLRGPSNIATRVPDEALYREMCAVRDSVSKLLRVNIDIRELMVRMNDSLDKAMKKGDEMLSRGDELTGVADELKVQANRVREAFEKLHAPSGS